MRIILSLAGAASAALAASLALHASSAVAETEGAVCMANPSLAEGAQVIAPASWVATLTSRGFVATTCDSALEQNLAQISQEVCTFAQSAPQPAKDGFQETYGVTPDELCQMTATVSHGEQGE